MSLPGPATLTGSHGRRYRPTGRGHAVAPFFFCATLYLVLGGGGMLVRLARPPGLPDLTAWHWPLLHLMVVGGVTQLIVGAMTFFAVTLLRTEPPPAGLTRGQWLLVNGGALGLAGGVLTGQPLLAVAGGLAILATLGLLAATLRLLRRRSLMAPDPTLRYYAAAIGCLLAGAILGIAMLLGWSNAGLLALLPPAGQMRLAHLHLNLNGWVMLTIVGTMRFFFPTVLGAPARFLNPAWLEERPLVAGVALSALGWLAGIELLVGAGAALQLVGTLAYVVAIARQWRAHTGPLSLAARHLLAGTLWLALLMLAAVLATGLRPVDPALAGALARAVGTASLLGFIGQTVLGAWTHLFSVVAALPAAPLATPLAPLRPRLRGILHGQAGPQLALANLGTGGVVAGQALAPLTPGLAAELTRGGLAALALLLLLVALKAARVVALVWTTRRSRTISHVPDSAVDGPAIPHGR